MSLLQAGVRRDAREAGIVRRSVPVLLVALFALGGVRAALAGPATRLVIGVPAAATAGDALAFTVTALDAFDNVDTGYTGPIRLTSRDPAATLPADATLANGTGTFGAVFRTAGRQVISGAGSGLVTGASEPIAVAAAAVSHLRIDAPAADVAGTGVAVTVTAFDRFDNVATGYAGPLRFTSTDGRATLPADSTLTEGAGVFQVTLRTSGPQTLTGTDVDDSAVTGTSGAIAVSGAAASRLAVTAPGSATAGTEVPFTVTALDAFDNVATGYDGVVHFLSTDRASTLPAAVALVDGVGDFSATLATAGAQTLTAVDVVRGSMTGTSDTIVVSAAPAVRFRVDASAWVTAGMDFVFTVTALDRFENVVTGHDGVVRLRSSDDRGILPAESTLADGVGTFRATLRTAGAQVLTATAADRSVTGVSDPIVVSAAAAAGFSITLPALATAGVPFSFTVAALDPFDNVAAGYGGVVRITSSDEQAIVSPDGTLTAGVAVLTATFGTAGAQTLTVADADDLRLVQTGPPIAVSAAAATPFWIGVSAEPPAGGPSLVAALDELDGVARRYGGTGYVTSVDTPASPPAKTPSTQGPDVVQPAKGAEGSPSAPPDGSAGGGTPGRRDVFDPFPVGVPTLDTLAFALLGLLLVGAAVRRLRASR
jgi:hypothetical protein